MSIGKIKTCVSTKSVSQSNITVFCSSASLRYRAPSSPILFSERSSSTNIYKYNTN